MAELEPAYGQAERGSRYIVVGLWNTAFGYAAFLLFLQLLQPHYVIAVVPAHIVGTTNAFFMQGWFVFPDGEHGLSAYLRFNGVYMGILAVNVAMLPVLVEFGGLPPWFAQIVLTGFLAIAGYLGNKFVSFRVKG